MKPLVTLALVALPALAGAQATAPYFQQEVNYAIDVRLDDRRHQLRGREELTYRNNSPEALGFIWFHLWPNAYRDNHTAFGRQQRAQGKRRFLFAKASERGFIDSLSFVVNGQPARLEPDPQNPDVAKLVLPQPLAPGATATVATPFRVQLPASFSRGGHVGQSYQVTQWYPKPAVLDRRGWHPMPYLDQGEFYSEYGSFDVRITLPANYTVGATGVLQTPAEVARMRQLALAGALKSVSPDGFGKDNSFPASAPGTKTLRYVQDRVHDFAWFADKRFNVLHDSVTLASGRVVQSWVLFTNRKAEAWKTGGLRDVNAALRRYSEWVGEYPYASATAVDGALSAGSGMEYPMVTVTEPDAVVHEVGHNWFYGILGSNERDFPWLDEGVNTYEQLRTEATQGKQSSIAGNVNSALPAAKIVGLDKLPPAALDQQAYQLLARRGLYQPVQGPASGQYTSINYVATVYYKTALSLRYLAGYLGQEKFDQAMRLYYQRWQFRHPYPEDMRAVFEESTGQPLGWFFGDMLTSTQRYDARIGGAALVAGGLVPGGLYTSVTTTATSPWPIPVSTVTATGRVLATQWTKPISSMDKTVGVNFQGGPTVPTQRPDTVTAAAVVVDAAYISPDYNRRNDRVSLTGSRLEPISLRPVFSPDRWDRAYVNWLPALGVNTSDKFMLGAAFFNSVVAPRKLQYLVMPMYSFHEGELNGIGHLQLNVLPARAGRELQVGATVQRFERYVKYEPSLTWLLPHQVALGNAQQRVRLSYTAIREQDTRRSSSNSFVTAEYGVRHTDALAEWGAHVDLTYMHPDNLAAFDALLLRAEASYLRYYSPKKRVQVRLFGGRFLGGDQNFFSLGLSGSPDYRRQTFFLDRQQVSNTFTAQQHQTDNRDGAFKSFLPVYSGSWLAALNVQADIPGLPLSLYADLGATPGLYSFYGRAPQRIHYDAGLSLPLFKRFIEVYFPLAGSQYLHVFPSENSEFSDNIRFVINFNKLNPFRALDEVLAE